MVSRSWFYIGCAAHSIIHIQSVCIVVDQFEFRSKYLRLTVAAMEKAGSSRTISDADCLARIINSVANQNCSDLLLLTALENYSIYHWK